MAKKVSRWLLNAETWVRARVSPCGIFGGLSATKTDFSPSSLVFPCRYHFTGSLYSYIIQGVNNRPVGGRSSETQSHPIDMNNSNNGDLILKPAELVQF
jgi:hypothetical protein